MASTSALSSRLTMTKQSSQQNLFQKIQQLQNALQSIQTDLFKLDEQAKSVQAYLDERAENTRGRLMSELKKFQSQVRDKIDNAKKQTAKLDQKINVIKQGQLASLQMILSLQRRIREIQVQLGGTD